MTDAVKRDLEGDLHFSDVGVNRDAHRARLPGRQRRALTCLALHTGAHHARELRNLVRDRIEQVTERHNAEELTCVTSYDHRRPTRTRPCSRPRR